MSSVACFVRQSQGREDSISLEIQREKTKSLADDLGDSDPDMYDFGQETGFSIFGPPGLSRRIDETDLMQELLDGLDSGEYDFLAAYDHTRVSNDEFYWVIKYHARVGGCRLEFVQDKPDDNMAFRVQRIVHTQTKANEIHKALEAKERRREQGMWDGETPFGLQYDSRSEYLEKNPEEWDEIETIFELLAVEVPYSKIVEVVDGIESAGTISKIKDRRELYEEHADEPLP